MQAIQIFVMWLLASYASNAMALWTTPIELMRRLFQKGPAIIDTRSSPDQFAGRTTLSSGSATVTVSTQQVNSDSIISLALQSVTALNSGFGADLCVRSISPGGSFVIGWSDGQTRAFDVVGMWEVKKTS